MRIVPLASFEPAVLAGTPAVIVTTFAVYEFVSVV